MTTNLPPLDDQDRTTSADPSVDRQGDALRDAAVERLKKRADFRMHLLMYVLFNGMFVLIWAMTGRHFFWPVFPMGIWGIGLVAHAVDTFVGKEPSEEAILEEIQRLQRR